MTVLPAEVKEAWEKREKAIVFTTVDKSGIPNSIYASCVKLIADDRIVVADNYFDKTRANILAGSPGSLLFITEDGKAYQVKGSIEYIKEGPVFDDMKEWVSPKLPGVAAAVLVCEKVFSGAKQLA